MYFSQLNNWTELTNDSTFAPYSWEIMITIVNVRFYKVMQPECGVPQKPLKVSLLPQWGLGNSTVVNVSVYQAGGPGSLPAQSVSERWNSISVLLICSHQCRRLVKKRPSMCYYVCVIMHVKDP